MGSDQRETGGDKSRGHCIKSKFGASGAEWPRTSGFVFKRELPLCELFRQTFRDNVLHFKATLWQLCQLGLENATWAHWQSVLRASLADFIKIAALACLCL